MQIAAARMSALDASRLTPVFLPVIPVAGRAVSSRMIRQKKYPTIRKKLWGGALWSPSYFAGSCGGAPLSVIRQYIEQQQTPS